MRPMAMIWLGYSADTHVLSSVFNLKFYGTQFATVNFLTTGCEDSVEVPRGRLPGLYHYKTKDCEETSRVTGSRL